MDALAYFVVRVLSGLVWVDYSFHLDDQEADAAADSLRFNDGYTAVVAKRWRH